METYTKSDTQKLRFLRSDIEQGQIKVPQFQRDYVWNEHKAAQLLDSMIKGYPIGALIYWRTDETLREVRDLGRIKFKFSDTGEKVNYVLDGQQRLTSILASIYGEKVTLKDGSIRDFSDMYVSLLRGEDDEPIVTMGRPPNVPIGACLRLSDLWSRKGDEFDQCPKKYRERRDFLNEQIRNYEIPKVILYNADLSIATEVFSRINTGGEELSVFEIMVARTYDLEKEFDLLERFDDFHEELSSAGFGTVDATDILQLVSLIIEDSCKKKTILNLDKSKFIDTWPLACEAARAAVNYVKTSLKIPVSRLLPYSSMIIPIAILFHFNDGKPVSKVQSKRVADWFWRCGWSERYSSSADTKLGQDKILIKKILSGDEHRIDWSRPIEKSEVIDAPFSVSRASSKTILALLASINPKKYDSSDIVYLHNDSMRRSDSVNFHHVFPRAYLRKKGYEEWESNRILNISLVDDFLNKRVIRAREPSDYMEEFYYSNDEYQESMRTHLINATYDEDDEANNAPIWSNDYERFLDERANEVVKLMKKRTV